ncbi:MAG: DNA topoisomerase III, partial [Bacteroidales bacterium]|nr:DNA topoisomerase III [Bacteroidales bacterium]
MTVCIAEKPSVAGDIAKVLGANSRKEGYYEGNGYQVTWTYGHLCCLKDPEEYNSDWKKWTLQQLPMIPNRFGIKLIPEAGIKKQFGIIKKLFSKADTIVNCGDAGQEGELIQRWVMQLAEVRCPVKRLWISSLTEESIRDGFRHLRDQKQYDNLYYAGIARASGDWLLGMNATRLYTLRYGGKGSVLSIGRVQTPTLALLVSRKKEIDTFKAEPYWQLTTEYKGVTFTSTEGNYTDKAKGQQALSDIMGKEFFIDSTETKAGKESIPQQYDLTTLQVECNRRFGYS